MVDVRCSSEGQLIDENVRLVGGGGLAGACGVTRLNAAANEAVVLFSTQCRNLELML